MKFTQLLNKALVKKQWRWAIAITALVLVVELSAGFYYGSRVENQQQRNLYLQSEISKLDSKLREIKFLKKRFDYYLTQLQITQSLNKNKLTIITFLSDVIHSIPLEWSVKKLKHLGETIELTLEMRKGAELELGLIRIKSLAKLKSLTLLSDNSYSSSNYRTIHLKLIRDKNLSLDSGDEQ